LKVVFLRCRNWQSHVNEFLGPSNHKSRSQQSKHFSPKTPRNAPRTLAERDCGGPHVGKAHPPGGALKKSVEAREASRTRARNSTGVPAEWNCALCGRIGITRWTNCYQSRRDPQTELRLRLRVLASTEIRYDYRSLTVMLRQEGCRHPEVPLFRPTLPNHLTGPCLRARHAWRRGSWQLPASDHRRELRTPSPRTPDTSSC
jgi:hypothetical protein